MSENIILTLTTIPSRLKSDAENGIKACIKSLSNQSYDDYVVHLNIPDVCKSTNEQYIIPDWIHEYKNIEIHRCDDIGSITKLIPTLRRVQDPDQTIIVVDDDIIYHPEMVSAHVQNRKTWPDCVVGYDGMRSRDENGKFANRFGDSRDYYFSGCNCNSLVDIIQHYKTVSYKRRFFKDDIYDFVNKYGTWCDDKTIAAYMSHHMIPRVITYNENDTNYVEHSDWLEHVGTSFPVVGNTAHERNEGCNVNRSNNEDDTKIKELFKYLDNGYVRFEKPIKF